MDDAWVGSIDIAIKKAKTAAMFQMESDALGKMSQPGKSLYNIEVSNDGLITFAGGLPVKDEKGRIVGAIGISGDTVENDKIVAQAAIDAVSKKKRDSWYNKKDSWEDAKKKKKF